MKKIITMLPNHFLTALTSWMSRAVSSLTQILSIGYLLDILGENNYALFVLLSGLIAWGTIADFGFGYSLQNFISERRAINRSYNEYIIISVCMMFIGFVLLMMLLWPLSKLIVPYYLQAFNDYLVSEKVALLYMSLFIFSTTYFGAVIYRIWFAEQKGVLVNIVSATISLVGFFFIFIISKANVSQNIYLIIFLFLGPAAVIPFFILIVRFMKEIKKASACRDNYSILVKPILKRSSGFLLFSILTTVIIQTDYLVMSQVLQPSEIITYSVLMKIFGVIFFVFSALLQALWPVCAEYRVQGKWRQLNNIVKLYLFLGVILVILSTIGIYLFKIEILGLISQNINSDIKWTIIALFGLYFILRIWSETFSMLLQSMNILKPLWYLLPVQALLNLGLQWNLSKIYGMEGMLLGLITSFLFTTVIFLPLIYINKVSKMNTSAN
ncbi:MATE family efflux transporter [Yersinia nurmii]|uniref:MATE family efflux transporter n=1 Tax=Yersinia nurmii TaxID=685706 RepID=A0AAW7K760_9GAMM|nr:MATE family efflux transporter [Yersinia nurmii]MDN0088602.1 MATE family efflux transporter [Yersinia nurmii]